MRSWRVLIPVLVFAAAQPGRAQSAADSGAIRATALDYIDGWYTGDAARMERALHPELAKRIVTTANGRSTLGQMGALTLIGNVRAGGGKATPDSQRREGVRILDIFQSVASVRVDASTWIDYLQLAKWNGRWVIVNVLWEVRAAAATGR